MGLLPAALMGGKRTHIHLTTYPLNTQGFVEARGHRPYAIAVDLAKCLHAGVALYIAGGETVRAAFTLTDGQDVQGIHPSCISAVYDAFTGKDVTDTIVQGSSRAQATPKEVFTAEAAPDDVPRVTVRTKEELQDALEYLTAAVEASRRLDKVGRLRPLRPRACRMTVQTIASASRPGGTHWVPQGENAGQEAMQVGAPLKGMLAPDEINEALNALHRRNVSLIEVDTDNEAEGIEPDIEAEPLLEEADRISVASSAPEFHECLPATDEDAARLGFVSAFAPEPENGPVGAACRTMRKLRKTSIRQCWRA